MSRFLGSSVVVNPGWDTEDYVQWFETFFGELDPEFTQERVEMIRRGAPVEIKEARWQLQDGSIKTKIQLTVKTLPPQA
jgi:hypothetical protein